MLYLIIQITEVREIVREIEGIHTKIPFDMCRDRE